MCYNENSAEHSIDWFNSQYEARWNHARKCFEKYDAKSRKPDNVEQRYGFSLHKYYFGQHRTGAQESLQDMMFHATFATPSLQFICNHEALFTLTIDKGHYNPDISRASYLMPANTTRNQPLSGTQVVWRMPFRHSGIRGGTSIVGNGEHIIKLLILDFSKAQLYDVSPQPADNTKTALVTYLSGYLDLLHKAGHAVLFCLPEFDDVGLHFEVDYSMATQTLPGASEVFGIDVEKINNHLSTSWLNAAMIAGTPEVSSINYASVSLAEYQSNWSSHNLGVHFHITFGPPKVEALCSQEIAIFFSLDDVSFYNDATQNDALASFSEWKFAFLFNINQVKLEDGNATRCSLDIPSGRFLEQYSLFPDYDEKADSDGFISQLVNFFTTEYFNLLESAEYHVIYHYDVRWPHLSGVFNPLDSNPIGFDDELESGEWRLDVVGEDGQTRKRPKAAVWKEILETSDTGGYDVITAISQTAINSNYRTLWQSSSETHPAGDILRKWTHSDTLEAQFQRINIRLLSDSTAILWIHVEHGSLKTQRTRGALSGDDNHTFADWRLAFQVPVMRCQHEEVPGAGPAWTKRFATTAAFKQYSQNPDRTFRHIYLNLERAEFVAEFSNFNGLFVDLKRQSIFRVQTLQSVIRKHYFQTLMDAGYHVIHTIPVCTREQEGLPYALADFTFQIHSDTEITRQTLKGRTNYSEPVIIILGTVHGRSIPAIKLDFSPSWIARAGRLSQCGAVSISKDLFLRARVLDLLSEVNAATTMIPRFDGVRGDDWSLDLIPWSMDAKRKGQPSPFRLERDAVKEGILQYNWKHHERWIYELLAGGHGKTQATQSYTVSCLTENHLEIPTAFRHGTMEFRVYGSVCLRVGCGDARVGPEQWFTESSATWSVILAIQSQAGGLNVSVNARQPEYRRTAVSGKALSSRVDSETLLRNCFNAAPDLKDVAEEFRVFEGMWKYCYPGEGAYNLAHPAFSQNGDLLFELHAYAPQGPPPASPNRNGAGRGWAGVRGRPGNHYASLSPENIVVDGVAAEDYNYSQNEYRSYSRNGRRTPAQEVSRGPGGPPSGSFISGKATSFTSAQRSRLPTPTPGRSRTPSVPLAPSPEAPQPQRAYPQQFRSSSRGAEEGQYFGTTSRSWTPSARPPTSEFREMHDGSPFSQQSSPNHVHLNADNASDRRQLRNVIRATENLNDYDMRVNPEMFGHPAANKASFSLNVNGAELHRKPNNERYYA